MRSKINPHCCCCLFTVARIALSVLLDLVISRLRRSLSTFLSCRNWEMRTLKNSSRLDEKIARNFSLSSRGVCWQSASNNTLSLKDNQFISLCLYRFFKSEICRKDSQSADGEMQLFVKPPDFLKAFQGQNESMNRWPFQG